MITLVRARNNRNKLEVINNRPFAIDIEMKEVGFRVHFLDLFTGKREYITYNNRVDFDADWEVIENIMYDRVDFGENTESHWWE